MSCTGRCVLVFTAVLCSEEAAALWLWYRKKNHTKDWLPFLVPFSNLISRERSYRLKTMTKIRNKITQTQKTQELFFGLCRLLLVQVCIAASEVTKNNGSFLETLYNRFFLLVKQLLTGNCAIYNGFFVCKYSSAAVKDECKNGIIFLSMRYFLVTPVMFLRRLVT